VSYSWVDPNFAALYARREDALAAERLLRAARERERRLAEFVPHVEARTEPIWLDGAYAASDRLRIF
jgi:hypothetical protein